MAPEEQDQPETGSLRPQAVVSSSSSGYGCVWHLLFNHLVTRCQHLVAVKVSGIC